MSSIRVLALILLMIAESLQVEETTITNTNITRPENLVAFEGVNEKISRRIIDDRLTPPRVTDFSLWSKRLPVGELHRLNPSPPRITEDLDDNVTEKAVPKKIRTVGSTQEPNCCGSKLPGANGFSDGKDKSQQNLASEALDLAQGVGAGPLPRFHGNNPNDDRYGQGWRNFNYLGYNKDREYYEQRNHHPYDRYNPVQRPTSTYAMDGDRYGTVQRPISTIYGTDSDRYSSSSNNRPGNYQSTNFGYGHGSGSGVYDRPRPSGGNFGVTNVNGEGDGDYPFSENGSPTGGSPSNLQTQKAIALKALAGVALIGAAAALATNPVFLPISVISGRRRRSVGVEFDNYGLTTLLQDYIQPKPNKVTQGQGNGNKKGIGRSSVDGNVAMRQELVISPQCVARLACHVHRDYLDELEKTKAQLSLNEGNTTGNSSDDTTFRGLEHWFDSLIHNNILVSDYLSDELKSLIQSAVAVGSDKNASCNNFSCLNVHDSLNKKST